MLERRTHPRVEVSGSVLYSKDIYPRLTIASVLDLSMGGTKIESLYSLTKDEGLEITISVPPQGIKCRGKVVYVPLPQNGKVKAGIEFEGLSEYDRVLLRQYLSFLMEQRALEA